MPRHVLLFAALNLLLTACEVIEVGTYPCPEGMDCSGNPPVHMGTGESTVGGACLVSGDCMSGSCVTVALLSALGVDTTNIDVPNGMCSQSSCTTDAECGEGGVCQDGSPFGNPTITLCMRGCTNLTQCRWKEGYSCWIRDPMNKATGICAPDSVIAAYYCPTGCK